MVPPLLYTYACAGLLGFGNDKLVAFTVDVDDLDRVIILEMLTKLGDIYIHATSVEVVVINPDGFEGKVTLENLILMSTEKIEKLRLLGGELG